MIASCVGNLTLTCSDCKYCEKTILFSLSLLTLGIEIDPAVESSCQQAEADLKYVLPDGIHFLLTEKRYNKNHSPAKAACLNDLQSIPS